MMIMATKAKVAFQTMPVTVTTSSTLTTPTINAKIAPPHADHPMDKFFGCQITNTKVNRNISNDKTAKLKLIPPYEQEMFVALCCMFLKGRLLYQFDLR